MAYKVFPKDIMNIINDYLIDKAYFKSKFNEIIKHTTDQCFRCKQVHNFKYHSLIRIKGGLIFDAIYKIICKKNITHLKQTKHSYYDLNIKFLSCDYCHSDILNRFEKSKLINGHHYLMYDPVKLKKKGRIKPNYKKLFIKYYNLSKYNNNADK